MEHDPTRRTDADARIDPRASSAPPTEQTTWSLGLIGFYASCAAVSLGAAIAAVSWLTFGGREGTTGIGAFGLTLSLTGVVGALFSLRSARRERRRR